MAIIYHLDKVDLGRIYRIENASILRKLDKLGFQQK